jgi:hypothetical protein
LHGRRIESSLNHTPFRTAGGEKPGWDEGFDSNGDGPPLPDKKPAWLEAKRVSWGFFRTPPAIRLAEREGFEPSVRY